jgi:putative ABC transport system permease protein
VNLARADIRHHSVRFLILILAVSSILTALIGQIGLYRGIIFEALLMINGTGTDLWVTQADRVGPFAEIAEIPDNLDRRLEGIPNVKKVRRFLQFNQQFEINGRRLLISVTGLDFPKDTGSWIPLITGRHLFASHYEAIADQSLGFVVGDQLRLGRDDYTIVGVATGQVDINGDGLLFVTIPDAQTVHASAPSEAILLGRAAKTKFGPPRSARKSVTAVMLELQSGADPERVRSDIRNWGDVAVLTRDEQVDIMLNGKLWRLRGQLLAFVLLTLIVTTIVVGLSIYTMTIEKTHQIALLKLIGAGDRVIVSMILEQALLIGGCSFVWSILYARLLFPHFPRTVLIEGSDVVLEGILTMILCAAASWFGIRKALEVRAQDVLS